MCPSIPRRETTTRNLIKTENHNIVNASPEISTNVKNPIPNILNKEWIDTPKGVQIEIMNIHEIDIEMSHTQAEIQLPQEAQSYAPEDLKKEVQIEETEFS